MKLKRWEGWCFSWTQNWVGGGGGVRLTALHSHTPTYTLPPALAHTPTPLVYYTLSTHPPHLKTKLTPPHDALNILLPHQFNPHPPSTSPHLYTEVRVAPVGMCTLAGCPPSLSGIFLRNLTKWQTHTDRRMCGQCLVHKSSVSKGEKVFAQNYSRFARLQIGLARHICYSHFGVWMYKVWSVYANIQAAGQMYIYLHPAHTATLPGSIFHQKFYAQSKTTVNAPRGEFIWDKRNNT